MNFHVLTLFPEMIENAAGTSILGRAIRNGCIHLEITNIRDYSANKHMRVDDYPYGGGAGMVMEAEPVFRAVRKAKETAGEDARVIYLTPQAEVLDQTKVEELASEEDLILLCGHYEGIDERVLEEVVTDYISIGDYVLTGGELGALVLMDAVSRFVPGVLNNEESSQFESLQDNLLEYPHYTRPEIWHEKRVPEVLLSGDHKKIEAWRHEESVQRTQKRRPDLLKNSFQLYAVSYGGALDTAGTLSAAASRYAAVLDYNRAKLRKGKRRFAENDLILFVSDEAGLEHNAAALENVAANMCGSETPAVFVSLWPDAGEEAADALDYVLSDILEAHGIVLEDVFVLPEEPSQECIAKTALEIRKRMKTY